MSILYRLRKLEQSNAASKGMLLLFLRIPGDNERDDYLSVSIPGVGHFERKPEETTEEFKRRAYATQAAGKEPGTMTAEEQAAAFRAGPTGCARRRSLLTFGDASFDGAAIATGH